MSIRERLLVTVDNFLSAVARGPDDVAVFEKSWTKLQVDINDALHNDHLDDSTISLVHDVASTIAILAERFLDFDQQCHKMSVALEDEMEKVFAHFGDAQQIQSSGGKSSSSTDVDVHLISADACINPTHVPLSEYGTPACQWLLDNIHNPYPSPKTKSILSQRTGASVKAIEGWFVKARRRIGWTELSREYFQSRRADTVDAAFRVFVQEDIARPVDPKIVHAFLNLKTAVETLCVSTSHTNALTGQLDYSEKGMISEEALQGKEATASLKSRSTSRSTSVDEKPRGNGARNHSSNHELPLSSPSQCNDQSPESLPDAHAIYRVQNREKGCSHACSFDERKQSHVHEPASLHIEERPPKRSRIDQVAPDVTTISPLKTGLPLLDSNVEDENADIGVFDFWTPGSMDTSFQPLFHELHTKEEVPVASTAATQSSKKRKRCISDSLAQGTPKHPCGVRAGPRSHVVSDPLPKMTMPESPFNDWDNFFRHTPDLPQTEGDEEMSFPTSIEVDLFNGWLTLQNSSDGATGTAEVELMHRPLDLPIPLFGDFSECTNELSPQFDSLFDANIQDFLNSLGGNSSADGSVESTAYLPVANCTNEQAEDADALSSSHGPAVTSSWPRCFVPHVTSAVTSSTSECPPDTLDLSGMFKTPACSSPQTSSLSQRGLPDDVKIKLDQDKLNKFEQLRALRQAAQQLEEELGVCMEALPLNGAAA